METNGKTIHNAGEKLKISGNTYKNFMTFFNLKLCFKIS